MTVLSAQVEPGQLLPRERAVEVIEKACQTLDFKSKRVLLIVPDGTRTAPVDLVFQNIHRVLSGEVDRMDVMVALGTHQPMSEEAICQRLGISMEERSTQYKAVGFLNHEWDNPDALKDIGTIPASEIETLSEGRFSMDVPVKINRKLFEYDQVVIIGPVFPHEVVGFSGGNKYLFPGVAGPEILNFFHWLGAVVTNPMIIGHKWTPVRKVVDRAAAMVHLEKLCISMVVEGQGLAGIFAGTPEVSWDAASDLSDRCHILYKDQPYHSILSCSPLMYDELWTGGKCMYKLEPVLADGGELIIYAPHIREISLTHGKILREIGYHCRDYFLKQWDKFKDYPWGLLAHSCHVHGQGTFEYGVEKPRARVTLATAIPESVCKEINLGYRDPASIDKTQFENREDEGVLFVPKAGEQLYRLSGHEQK